MKKRPERSGRKEEALGVAQRAEELLEFTLPIKNLGCNVVNMVSDKWYDSADKRRIWMKFHD